MSKGDIKEMEAGRMDPSGMGITKAAFWLSVVAVGFMVLGVFLAILLIALMPSAPPPQRFDRQQPQFDRGFSIPAPSVAKLELPSWAVLR